MFLLALFLSLCLATDRLGLVPQDQVEAGDVARAFSFGIEALRAGGHRFVTLRRRVSIDVPIRADAIRAYLDLSLPAVLTPRTWFALIYHRYLLKL